MLDGYRLGQLELSGDGIAAPNEQNPEIEFSETNLMVMPLVKCINKIRDFIMLINITNTYQCIYRINSITFLKGRSRPFFDLVPSGKMINESLFSTTARTA